MAAIAAIGVWLAGILFTFEYVYVWALSPEGALRRGTGGATTNSPLPLVFGTIPADVALTAAGVAGLLVAPFISSGVASLDARVAAAWTHGELVFAHATLGDVLAELSRWYDLDIRVGNAALTTQRVTLSFRDEPVDDVFSALAATINLAISKRVSTQVVGREGPLPARQRGVFEHRLQLRLEQGRVKEQEKRPRRV